MSETHDHDDEHHDHPIGPHFINLLVLFALTTITWAVAVFVPLGAPWDDVIAIAIAFTKVTLVIMIFMHVKDASKLVKVTAFSGFFWIFLFFVYLVGDIKTRDDATWYEGWQEYPQREYPAPDPH